MTFKDLSPGDSVFLDSNTLVYHFSLEPLFGGRCTELLERIEKRELQGFVSVANLSDAIHKLVCHEACAVLGAPRVGITRWLGRHPTEVTKLTLYRMALDEVHKMNVAVLSVHSTLITAAADIIQQTGLLSGDALVIAVMRDHGLTNLASNDADFDRVPGIARYAPV